MLPMGGFCGLAVALGGCVEYQQNDNPHFHGNLHLANVYQFKTLPEIAELIQQNLVSLKDLTHFQDWICHEDPLDLDAHKASLPQREEQWMEHNSAKACDTLCCFPSYLRQESPVSMWSDSGPCDVESALSEGATWRDTYFADAEMVFSYCHHHWHPTCPKTGQREPIRHCRPQGGGCTCKAGFPAEKRLILEPKIICPGNARKHGLRVAGRRNALGSVLSRRRCPWRSGSARAMAAFLRHNTHTGPNYRVPLMKETHDPACQADCLTKQSLVLMAAAAQRAQRNTTGYYTGYIQKRQAVGKFALRQATMNLKYIAKTIEKRSNRQQYHHIANRMLGDLEFRGHARPATEEFNLAANHDKSDVTKAEFLRTFASTLFFGGQLLQREEQLRKRTEEARTVIESSKPSTCDAEDAAALTAPLRIPQPFKELAPRAKAHISFTDAYGYRGTAKELYLERCQTLLDCLPFF